MTEIEKKFADITRIFSSDGYEFLMIRTKLDNLNKQGLAGDKDAEKLVEVFNRCHRLFAILAK
jgi:hypothetical protein